MRMRAVGCKEVVLLLFLGSVTRWAVASPCETRSSAAKALGLWNEGRSDEAIAELQELIGALERCGDDEKSEGALKGTYILLGLIQRSVHDDASARESFARAGVNPRASAWEMSASDLLALDEKLRVEAPVSGSPGSTSHKALREEEAGEELDLAIGRRVRVELPGHGHRLVGSLSAITDGTLVLVSDDQSEIELPRDRVRKLEMSYGRRGHGLLGLVIGAGTGALVGALDKPDENCVGEDCLTRAENIGYGALGAGLIGGLVGALVKTDQWLEIPSGRIRVRMGAVRRGAGVQVVWSF